MEPHAHSARATLDDVRVGHHVAVTRNDNPAALPAPMFDGHDAGRRAGHQIFELVRELTEPRHFTTSRSV
jgi:hypothetical protein